MRQIREGYSSFQILLHWLVAGLVLFQLLFGESMTTVVDAQEEAGAVSGLDQSLGSAHYWVGIAILILVALRLALRLSNGAPPIASGPTWMQVAAKMSHVLFYVLLLATPIVGLLAFYVGDPWGDIHSLNKPIFIILIAVHAIAAMIHHFALKDETMRRMISPAE